MGKKIGLLVFLFGLIVGIVFAGEPSIPVYKNKDAAIPARVNDLLSRMTLEEKVDLVGGAGFVTKRNVRLGIPQLIMTDGPLGPNGRGHATNYSAMINLAATFDVPLMSKVAQNIGEEVRILGRNMLLGPCINIARVPQGGRTFEGFGEDPYLVSQMAVAYVKGVQSKNVVTCTKHYVANNQEWNRYDVSAELSERALREIYLPAFRAVVQKAGGLTIMGAYNRVRGTYACEKKYLLTDILKKEWGFQGVVVTDWGASHSTVKMANAGLDLEMPTGKFYGEKLLQAIREGKVSEATLNDKVRRILRVMFRAGLFDESIMAYGGFDDTPERRALALRAARESIVLLKNEGHFLPLNKKTIHSIAVIGPNGNVARMFAGGSGSLHGNYGISPLEGIRKEAGPAIKVAFAPGIRKMPTELPIVGPEYYRLPNGKPGIFAEYFNNREQEGKPVLKRVEKAIDFDWGYGGERDPSHPGSPAPGIVNLDKWSARWTGKFRSPGEGWYYIGLKSDNGVRLYLNGKKIIDSWIDSKPGKFKITKYKFRKNKLYDLRVDFYENVGSCQCKLGVARYKSGNFLQQAVDLAKKSDVAVLCMGLDPEMEGEAVDRDSLPLPSAQERLIRSVAHANKNCVVVLNNATPILMNRWLGDVPALVEALYPGQEGGTALADILFGKISPSGRLPLTFPKRWEDTPVHDSYPGKREVAYYKEGILVGYRYYDAKKIEPLFPFGYGLSYTTFSYKNLRLTPQKIGPQDTVTVRFEVKNTGQMAGDEVVQLYVHDEKASVFREPKSLKGFARVSLKPGETKTVTLKLDRSALSFYSPKRKKWVAEPGWFDVLIGSSSRDIRLKGRFLLSGAKK